MKTGLLHQRDGRIFLEASVDMMRAYTLRKNYLPPHKQRLLGRYTSIWGQFTHNYGHWMMECLMRLYALSSSVEKGITVVNLHNSEVVI